MHGFYKIFPDLRAKANRLGVDKFGTHGHGILPPGQAVSLYRPASDRWLCVFAGGRGGKWHL